MWLFWHLHRSVSSGIGRRVLISYVLKYYNQSRGTKCHHDLQGQKSMLNVIVQYTKSTPIILNHEEQM